MHQLPTQTLDFINLKEITALIQAALVDTWEAGCFYMGGRTTEPQRAYIEIYLRAEMPMKPNAWKQEPGFNPEKLALLTEHGVENAARWVIEKGKEARPEAFIK